VRRINLWTLFPQKPPPISSNLQEEGSITVPFSPQKVEKP